MVIPSHALTTSARFVLSSPYSTLDCASSFELVVIRDFKKQRRLLQRKRYLKIDLFVWFNALR